jgi:hypothetical protein
MIKMGIIFVVVLAALGGLAPWNYVSINSPANGVYNFQLNTNGLSDATKSGFSKVKKIIDKTATEGEQIQNRQLYNDFIPDNIQQNYNEYSSNYKNNNNIVNEIIVNEFNKYKNQH